MNQKNIRTYTELMKLKTFEERFEYLKLGGVVGEETFGFDRYINQMLYKKPEWISTRNLVIARDMGCDLGVEDYDIVGKVIVHHMNPITVDDIVNRLDYVLNPEYLISSSMMTHNAIHYGSEELLPKPPVVRTKNDMCPWRH